MINEQDRAMSGDTQRRIDQIKEAFPYDIGAVQIHENGDDFVVIEVNQEWMFRFPRNVPAQKALQCEKRFLPKFEKIASLSVPQIRYVGDDFIGYRKIEGALLTPQLFNTLQRETQKRIARQIGEFLAALHTFPLEEAFNMGVTEGWSGWREKAYKRFRESVAPLLSTETRENAIAFLDRFFALEWKRVIIHGDFYPPDHVFFSEEGQELCGVIDFGDLTIEDAATDFKSILQDFGEGFLWDVMAHYSGEIDAKLLDRIKIRIEARPLFDASYAFGYGFEERFKKCLSEIEAMFRDDRAQHARPADAASLRSRRLMLTVLKELIVQASPRGMLTA